MGANPAVRIDERLCRRGGWVELLRLPAFLFRAGVSVRNALYDRGFLTCERLELPVISIGNLSVGGTGKTPAVVHLVGELRKRDLWPGILSRGYGGRSGGSGRSDEGELLARLFPEVPQVEDKDRVRGGHQLVALGVDAVVLDDGFQHRRLARDLDFVLVDATRPWGLSEPHEGSAVRAFLPRGLLREDPRSLRRASAVVLTRVDQAPRERVDALREELSEIAPGVPWVECVHAPTALRDPAGVDIGLESLWGREVDLVSGVGNPSAFESSVRALGARPKTHRRFPDHHVYRRSDLEGLGTGRRWILTTSKDAPKVPELDAPVLVLEIALKVVSGGAVLEALLDSLPLAPATLRRRALHEGLHG